MSDLPKRKEKRTWLRVLITFIVIGGLAGGGLYLLRLRNQRQAQEALENLETTTYSRGSLSASISGTGTVRANQQALLSWTTSGTVGAVPVALGQIVNEGQVLLSLREDDLPVDILQAQIDVINIQNSIDALYDNNTLDLAKAEVDLVNARQEVENARDARVVMDYARCTDERIAELQEDYDDAYDAYKIWPTDATLKAVDIALANLNFCKATYSQDEIDKADARLNLANENFASLEKRVETLRIGPDPDELIVLEKQLVIAKARIAKKEIPAPFKSTVTGIYALIGDQVAAGVKAVQLADLTRLFIDVQISEVDIPLVLVGQNADMVFDAYFEETYHGIVQEISPIGTELQGVVTYKVTILLTEGLEKIKPGMTAAINIITEVKDGVFIIPSAALASVDGKDTVFVMRNGQPVGVEVTVGAYSDDSLEIVEADIKEGETIVINPPTSILSIMGNSGRVPRFFTGR